MDDEKNKPMRYLTLILLMFLVGCKEEDKRVSINRELLFTIWENGYLRGQINQVSRSTREMAAHRFTVDSLNIQREFDELFD
jgi:hypothetical protein